MAELDIRGVGVATKDAELKYVGDKKTPLCNVNLAFNRSYKSNQKDTEWQKEVCFMRAQIWGARAERMAELVKTGQPMYVSGYLKQDTWTDKESGQKRVSYSITLRDFQLCVKNGKKSEAQTASATTAPQESSANDNNDIPF